MVMYEARQNKEKVSRRINLTGSKINHKHNAIFVQKRSHKYYTTIQRSYEILQHETQTLNNQVSVARTVDVNLIPDSHSLTGTQPGSSKLHDDFMNELNRRHPNVGFIRGHLLNDNLGGPGLWDNMFPISSEANKHHLNRVERPVKRLLIRQYEYYPGGTRSIVHYRVSVIPDTPHNFLENPTAYMFCSWSLSPTKSNEDNFGFAIIKSSAQQESGQNSKLRSLGWGSGGTGNAKHGKFIKLCKQLCIKSFIDAHNDTYQVSDLQSEK